MNERPIRKIYYTSKFKKSLAEMPRFVQQAFLKREGLFLHNAFHPSLDTHKLHGKYKEFWAFTAIGQYRVMFGFIATDKVAFINIGTHTIYR